MPEYTLPVPYQQGKTFRVEFDREPTPADVAEIQVRYLAGQGQTSQANEYRTLLTTMQQGQADSARAQQTLDQNPATTYGQALRETYDTVTQPLRSGISSAVGAASRLLPSPLDTSTPGAQQLNEAMAQQRGRTAAESIVPPTLGSAAALYALGPMSKLGLGGRLLGPAALGGAVEGATGGDPMTGIIPGLVGSGLGELTRGATGLVDRARAKWAPNRLPAEPIALSPQVAPQFADVLAAEVPVLGPVIQSAGGGARGLDRVRQVGVRAAGSLLDDAEAVVTRAAGGPKAQVVIPGLTTGAEDLARQQIRSSPSMGAGRVMDPALEDRMIQSYRESGQLPPAETMTIPEAFQQLKIVKQQARSLDSAEAYQAKIKARSLEDSILNAAGDTTAKDVYLEALGQYDKALDAVSLLGKPDVMSGDRSSYAVNVDALRRALNSDRVTFNSDKWPALNALFNGGQAQIIPGSSGRVIPFTKGLGRTPDTPGYRLEPYNTPVNTPAPLLPTAPWLPGITGRAGLLGAAAVQDRLKQQ